MSKRGNKTTKKHLSTVCHKCGGKLTLDRRCLMCVKDSIRDDRLAVIDALTHLSRRDVLDVLDQVTGR
jgi:hypothetical protein